jgi:aspartyl-tRNA(Asn)/glutamyl-tRNA(Gln) amidotransferase subunit B
MLIERGAITGAIAKGVFETMLVSEDAAEAIVTREGLTQIDDEEAILDLVADVVARHGDAVAQYRAGKTASFGFLVGQVMKGSGGKANPKLANQLLKQELDRSPKPRIIIGAILKSIQPNTPLSPGAQAA